MSITSGIVFEVIQLPLPLVFPFPLMIANGEILMMVAEMMIIAAKWLLLLASFYKWGYKMKLIRLREVLRVAQGYTGLRHRRNPKVHASYHCVIALSKKHNYHFLIFSASPTTKHNTSKWNFKNQLFSSLCVCLYLSCYQENQFFEVSIQCLIICCHSTWFERSIQGKYPTQFL